MAERRHMGTMRMMARGRFQLSYWAARTRKTKRTQSGKDVDDGVAGEDLLVGEIGPLDDKPVREVFLGEALDRGRSSRRN
jgi:hypothetical protein